MINTHVFLGESWPEIWLYHQQIVGLNVGESFAVVSWPYDLLLPSVTDAVDVVVAGVAAAVVAAVAVGIAEVVGALDDLHQPVVVVVVVVVNLYLVDKLVAYFAVAGLVTASFAAVDVVSAPVPEVPACFAVVVAIVVVVFFVDAFLQVPFVFYKFFLLGNGSIHSVIKH